MTGQLIVTEYAWLPLQPLASVTEMVKEDDPAAVGVPESTPAPESEMPAGSVPELKVNEYGAVPPVALIVAPYGVPTVPLDIAESPIGAQITTV
jgi:hypothetical protein